MVFANLGPREKDAFFSLLDEYFASRPEILSNNNSNNDTRDPQTAVAVAASSAVRDAVVKHPEATARFMTAGLKHMAAANSASAGSSNNHNHGNKTSSSSNTGVGDSAVEEEPPSMAGRIAAAQAMFSGKHNPFAKHGKEQSSTPSQPPPAPPPSYGTSGFGPPPVRRTPSSATAAGGGARLPPPPAAPPPVREEQGEWVEALYDYDSGEAGDLRVKEGERILLVERTSDDWWTGELDGSRGLIPASYVKAL